MDTTTTRQQSNRLAAEKSPYLLQHKDNPVDWLPWGEEAFERAKKEDKPIFLSVGYSTCHWCHVMAHESFEDPRIAQLMNENFVNIKVDREERPDVDKIYMTYVQALSGGGGWPMSVWLTPNLTPIVGGTYFPPADKYGRKGFPSILTQIATMWKTNREELIQQGDHVMDLLRQQLNSRPEETAAITQRYIDKCYEQISSGFDPHLGGFSGAPKFPRPAVFDLLFRVYSKEPSNSTKAHKALHMCLFTLTKMGEGGVYDHLGGGFHRYSVTSDWHVPHFEKMLYDQAQLINANLVAYQISKGPFFEQIARGTMDYVLRDMTSPEGGFFSAEDADSYLDHEKTAHAEGAFYVWKKSDICSLLGEKEAKVFIFHYGVEGNGNVAASGDPHGEFTGKNILMQRHAVSDTAHAMGITEDECHDILRKSRELLFKERDKRPRPHLDDKIITAWNGLMISALSHGYSVLGDQKYLDAAKNSAKFIRAQLYKESTGVLIRNYREGPSSIEGFTDDYSFLIQGLIDLYEASFEGEWLKWAIALQKKQNELFWDGQSGGYYAVKEGSKDILLRVKEDYDGAEPSNNSVSALNLLRLSQMSGNDQWRTDAEKTISAFHTVLSKSPIVVPYMCVAVDFYLATPMQIVLVGKRGSDDLHQMFAAINDHFIPNKIMLGAIDEDKEFLSGMLPIIKDMNAVGGKATAYVCENFTCKLPVNNVPDLQSLLK